MTLHLVNARLIDPEGYDGPGALRVVDGVIEEVVRGASPAPGEGQVVDCGGLPLAPGIVDMRVFVGEPGARHRKSFRSAGAAAAAGGITTVATQPDTQPPLDDPALVEFVLARARDVTAVRVHVMAALTRGLAGAEMTEQRFLLDAGALALTDADRPVADSRLMRAIMTYARGQGALVVHHCQDPALSKGACATAGEFASRLGLPAAPAVAERIMLERDLALVESTGVRYHADQVTTASALAALRRAKEAGLPVTAATSIHHLTLNEFDIADYRTFFKLTPPLSVRGRPRGGRRGARRGADRHRRLVASAAGRGGQAAALRGGGNRRRRARDLPAGLPAAGAWRVAGSGDAVPAGVARACEDARAAGRTAGAGRARGPGAVRPGCALRAEPREAALAIEEHALRPDADAGPRHRHLCRRPAGLRGQ